VQPEETYLNLVMEFVPETIAKTIRNHAKNKKLIPIFYTQVSTGAPPGGWTRGSRGCGFFCRPRVSLSSLISHLGLRSFTCFKCAARWPTCTR
jgi:hypothetical protein